MPPSAAHHCGAHRTAGPRRLPPAHPPQPCHRRHPPGTRYFARCAHLARLTGFSTLTCRRALRALLAEGTLARGASRNARPRVAAPVKPGDGDASAGLSRALAALRRKAGLTQPGLAALTGYSVTTVGHAETGRLWQARAFWEKADLALAAEGELTRRHDAFRAGLAGPARALAPQFPPSPVPGPAALARVTLHWDDGTSSVFYPPAGPGAGP